MFLTISKHWNPFWNKIAKVKKLHFWPKRQRASVDWWIAASVDGGPLVDWWKCLVNWWAKKTSCWTLLVLLVFAHILLQPLQTAKLVSLLYIRLPKLIWIWLLSFQFTIPLKIISWAFIWKYSNHSLINLDNF